METKDHDKIKDINRKSEDSKEITNAQVTNTIDINNNQLSILQYMFYCLIVVEIEGQL